jgi:hypothetical protein
MIYEHLDKNNFFIKEKINIIDFNKNDGKKIRDVLTLSGESLVEFHKKLFNVYNINIKDFVFFDGSSWLRKMGGNAKEYYKKDLMLYICHGILFENFLSEGDDGKFSKEILLPAIKEVKELSGCKPLIVPIPPMDIEDDDIWFSYDKKVKEYLNYK